MRGDIKKDAWMLTDSELRMFVQDYAKSESTFFQVRQIQLLAGGHRGREYADILAADKL